MIQLYFHWNAVCAMKVVMALEEKGLAWDGRHVELSRFEQLQDWYLALNPAGVVPTMVHDGVVILESTVMNEFLDDAYPQTPLRPGAPHQRAKMRWWGKQVDDVVHPSIRPISFTRFVTPIAEAMDQGRLDELRGKMPKKELSELWRRVASSPYSEAELAEYLHKLDEVLERMETTLRTDPWLAGEALSLADINMTPYFRRLVQLEQQALWSRRPAVSGWFERIQSRPSFAAMDRLCEIHSPAKASGR